MGEAKILLFAYLNRHQPPETMNFALVPVVVALLLVDEVLGSNHHGGWLTFDDMADGDPHLAVHLQGNLDRPLCYNLLGEPGQVWSVFTDDHLAVSSTPIHAPFKKKGTGSHTYFGRFHFQFRDGRFLLDGTLWGNILFCRLQPVRPPCLSGTRATVTPRNITIHVNGQNDITIAWPPKVHKSVLVALPHAGITVRHERWNVVSLQFGEKVFYMDRSSRKFRLNRRSPIDSVDFLGIYVKHDYLPKYGGIIGEFVGKTGAIVTDHNESFLLYSGRRIPVIKHTILNHLNKQRFDCWLVEDVGRLFQAPLLSYYHQPLF